MIYETPDAGSYNVLLKRGEFVDSTRQNDDGSVRSVAYKIYHPSEDHDLEAMPLILWSHGFGGNRDGAAFLSRYLASHGYILVHMTHHGTDSSLWEGKPGHPWDHLREAKITRTTTLNRMRDVSFVLDQLKDWAKDNPGIGAHIDFDNIAMSGHSFGALTTQIMAGQLIPDETFELISMHEPRFKCGVLYSPVPVAHIIKDKDDEIKAYQHIKTPLLHMTGTDDGSPLEDFGHERRLHVLENTIHAPGYALIKKDGDHMVYNGTRGKLKDNPLRERHEDIIKATAHAYFDMHLKNSVDAKQWLDGDGVQSYLGNNAIFEFKDAA